LDKELECTKNQLNDKNEQLVVANNIIMEKNCEIGSNIRKSIRSVESAGGAV
jgi:hypothetical protein